MAIPATRGATGRQDLGIGPVLLRIVALLFTTLLPLTGCDRSVSNPAPPRVTTPAQIPVPASTIVVPISAPLAELSVLVNAEVPATLLAIDREEKACLPAQRLIPNPVDVGSFRYIKSLRRLGPQAPAAGDPC